MLHSLYKYYSERKWAEAFLEGQIRFQSLSYFRDYEDEQARGDRNEGSSIFHPKEGLLITNHTRGFTTIFPGGFKSTANQDEIFVLCLSRSLTDEMCRRFNAVVCIQVLDIPQFCARIVAALPSNAKFPGRTGRTRIGNRVEYYKETDGGKPNWALPDLIAISKLDSYTWQNEYRLVFCLTDALDFEKVMACSCRSRA